MRQDVSERKEESSVYALYWIGATIVFLLVEIMTLGLTSIWFAAGTFVAGIAAFVGASLMVQMILFLVITAILFVLTRPWAKKYLNSRVQKTNVDALIGEKGLVRETIDNRLETGKVYVNGLDWTARSEDGIPIPKDMEVKICDIRGVKLIVRAISEDEEEA